VKVLIDATYTGRPSTCSTSYLSWKVITEIASAHPDAFFYLTAPREYIEQEDQLAFWNAQQYSDRVHLLPVDSMVVDRMAELYKFTDQVIDYVGPTSDYCWDADVLVTTRVSQITNFRTNTSRNVGFGKGTYRGIFGLDEMPMLGFRDTVAWGNSGQVDLNTFAQYLAADGLIISDLWTKKKMLQLAREYLTPSRCIELAGHVQEALPVKLTPLALKQPKQPKEFNVIFAGRMTGTRNFKEVAELFRKHYSMPLGKGKMNFIVSTQSMSTGASNPGEIDFVTLEKNNREQFYALLKDRAHVVVNLSTVEDFSLSTYEPLLFGTPVVVPDRPWSDFLGPDYPFRAKSFTEAYAIVKDMERDYPAAYAKFVAWHESYWVPFVNGPRNRSTPSVLRGLIEAYQDKLFTKLKETTLGGAFRDIAQRIVDEGHKEVDLLDYVRKNDLIVWHKDWKRVPQTKRPNLHLLKLIMHLHGYVDTLEVGVVRKP
jgi:hypothetical protein